MAISQQLQDRIEAVAPDDTVSTGVLRKVVYAGSHASSFQQASKDLKEEAELDITVRFGQRLPGGEP